MNEKNEYLYSNIKDPIHWRVCEIILEQSSKHPNLKIIKFIDGPEWTYNDLKIRALQKANILKQRGFKKGDAITVFIQDPKEFILYWIASNFLGLLFVALNTAIKGNVLLHQIKISKSKYVIVEDIYFEEVHELINKNNLDVYSLNSKELSSEQLIDESQVDFGKLSDDVCVMFTSGTSGPSKGVMMPNAHCVLFAVGTIENYNLKQDHNFYISLPLFHANGLFMQLLACLMTGAKAIIRSKFSASNWLDDVRKYKITHTNMLGAIAAFVVSQPPSKHDKDHQLIVIGSAPLPSEPERVFRERFGVKHVLPLYGMTEVNIPIYGLKNEIGGGKCGKVYEKYFEVEIRDPDKDIPIEDGMVGEIMVRPKQPFGFMSGYMGMPDKTIETWRNFWFHTGDAGIREPSGHFIFVDRIKDCIRRRGENISSYEVEQAFLEIPYITEAAAYAIPADGGDGMEDEVMVALMIHDDVTINFEDLIKRAKNNLAKFSIPKYLRIMKEFPKTQTGKIQKIKLREEGVTVDTWQNYNI